MRGMMLPVFCATLALCACASGRKADSKEAASVEGQHVPEPKSARAGEDRLDQTAWVLTRLPGRELVENTQVNTQVTLSFAEGKLGGSDGCNRFSTQYVADGEALTIEPGMASTRAACLPPIEEQASAFIKALGSTRKVKMDTERLSLLDESGALLASFVAQQTVLSGTRWKVVSYNNGHGGVTSLIQGTSLSLALAKDGGLSGSAGCNRFKGAYTVNGTRIQLSPAATTRRMCAEPEGVMEQEAAFLKALERSQVARFEGDRLELRSESGALMVSARRSAQDTPDGTTGDEGREDPGRAR